MPIKKLRVSFDIDAQMFVAMLTHGDMNIEVFGNEPSVSHTERIPPMQDVQQIASLNGMRGVILSALKKSKKLPISEIRILIVKAGYSAKSLNSQLAIMQGEKTLKRAGYAMYAITKKGLNNV